MAERRLLSNEEFAHRLRRAVDAKKAAARAAGDKSYGLRSLGRALDPSDPDRARRNIQRYLAADHQPRGAMRRLLAEELGLTEDQLTYADDEDDPEGLVRDLYARLGWMEREMKELKWMISTTNKGVAA